MHVVNSKRKQIAGMLLRFVEKHRSACDPDRAAALDILGQLSDFLVSGHLSKMSPVRCAVNRRIFGPRADRELSQEYSDLRRALLQLRTAVQSFKDDPEIIELLQYITTVYRLLVVDPKRVTPLPDGRNVPYVVYFTEVMRAAIEAVSMETEAAVLTAA